MAITCWSTKLRGGVTFLSCTAQGYAARLPHSHWGLTSGETDTFSEGGQAFSAVFPRLWTFSLFWFLETPYLFLQDQLCIQKSGHLIPASQPVLCSTTGSNKPRAIGDFSLGLFFFLSFKRTHSHKNCSLIQLKPKPSVRQKSYCSSWKNYLPAHSPHYLDHKQLSVGQARN